MSGMDFSQVADFASILPDMGDLLESLIRKLVELFTLQFSGRRASKLVSWLARVPDVTSPKLFPHLNGYRHDLTYAGMGLLSFSFLLAALRYWVGGFVSGGVGCLEAAGRAVGATALIVGYPVLVRYGIEGTNLLTGSMVTHTMVEKGLSVALAGAFTLSAALSVVSLGFAVAAVFISLIFLAGILILKIGITAILAMLIVGGPLAIAMWPLPETAWVTRLWGKGVVVCLAVPVIWAVVFTTAALLAEDSIAWAQGLGGTGLSSIVSAFTAATCFYVAYKLPVLFAQYAQLGSAASSLQAGLHSVKQHMPSPSRLPGLTRTTTAISSKDQTNKGSYREVAGSSSSKPYAGKRQNREGVESASIDLQRGKDARANPISNGRQGLAEQVKAKSGAARGDQWWKNQRQNTSNPHPQSGVGRDGRGWGSADKGSEQSNSRPQAKDQPQRRPAVAQINPPAVRGQAASIPATGGKTAAPQVTRPRPITTSPTPTPSPGVNQSRSEAQKQESRGRSSVAVKTPPARTLSKPAVVKPPAKTKTR